MNREKKELVFLRNLCVALVTLISLVIGLFIFVTVRSVRLEKFCEDVAISKSRGQSMIFFKPGTTTYHKEFLRCKSETFFAL